jgi:hypothetical protein
MRPPVPLPLALCALLLLSGCELLGIPSPDRIAAQRDAEGKAIGAACRHDGRAVFAGWREMNDYMVENKLDVIAPTLPPPGAAKPEEAEAQSDSAPAAKGARRS